MPFNQSTRRTDFKSPAAWAGAAITSLGFLFGSSAAFAVAPPVNTVIGNQASASYSDASGNIQLATSNLVQTTVQQVGSFTLDTVNQLSPSTIVNTKTGSAGATLYAPHTLTNTGNGSDSFVITVGGSTSFSKVEVYADINGDGIPESTTPLCSAVTAATCTVPAQTVPGGNGNFTFVVAYSIPSSAVTPTAPFDSAIITATPGTPALYTAPNTSVSDKDIVNLTTAAAFNMTKTIGLPLVAAPGGGAWPTASTGGQSSAASATCSTIYPVTSSATCTYTVYTLTFNNSGAAAGPFVLTDALPSGLTYVAGSAVWSNKPGVALNNAGGVSQSGIDFSVTAGGEIDAVIASIAPNVTQTLSFVVRVNSAAIVGSGNTTNIAKFSQTSPAVPPVGPGPFTIPNPGTTNPSIFTVLQTYGIAVGTGASTSATALDTTAGSGNGTADLSTQPNVVAGGSVKFLQTVFNTGNGSDTVNLSAPSGTSSFPAGTAFTFFAADGVSPLLDTNGDGIPDTGPLAAGASVNIVVQAIVPSSATVGAGPFNVIVVGKSLGDSTKIDGTIDRVTTVIGSLVDVTNTPNGSGVASVGGGDLGPGPSPLPTTTNSTPAGTGTVFTLFLKNNDTLANSYNLSASQTTNFPGTLPAGWTVKYVAAGGTCASAAISQPVSVAAGAQVEVDACVTPPATQLAETAQKIYFQVQSAAPASNGVIVRDAVTDAVTVTTVATHSAVVTPSNSGQVAPGGTVVFPHSLINTGNQSCGAYTLTATLPAADVTAGWTTAIYLDTNGNGVIDAGDTLVTGPQTAGLAVGVTQKFLVKLFAPGAGVAGAVDVVTVTATFPPNDCGQASATDASTVVTGQIRVVKAQALDASCSGVAGTFSAATFGIKPGQCVIYQVIATNQGSGPVSNVSIGDAVPAFTTLSTSQPAAQCVSVGVTGTPVFANTAATVSCGSAVNTVAPGGTVTLTYAVKVNQ